MSYRYDHEDPATWLRFHPLIIAHDVGHTRDRSTAVIGGNSPVEPRRLGILDHRELPIGLCGRERACALAAVDRHYNHNALIVADLSHDESYAEMLYESFGLRVIGIQISRSGNGTQATHWRFRDGFIPVYTVGRTHLIELYLAELKSRLVRIVDSPMAAKAHAQLEALEVEHRESGTVYRCPNGQHDDLGISCAMLAWAARHPHLPYWVRTAQPVRPSYQPPAAAIWRAWT